MFALYSLSGPVVFFVFIFGILLLGFIVNWMLMFFGFQPLLKIYLRMIRVLGWIGAASDDEFEQMFSRKRSDEKK